jgi:acetoin utilization protein AcuB
MIALPFGAGMRVRDYMSSPAITIDERESVASAQSIMRDRGIRHLPVTRDGQLVGVVSERDIFLLLSLHGLNAEKEPVEEAMTEVPFTVHPDDPLALAARAMARGKFGSAVVVDGERIVGMLSVVDVLSGLADGR